MQSLIQFKRLTLLYVIPLALAFLALSPTAQSVIPPPDGAYPGFNTAEGQNALLSSLGVHTIRPSVGIRSRATPTPTTTWLSVLGRSMPTPQTETRGANASSDKAAAINARLYI